MKNKKRVLKSKWQKVLEIIAIVSIMLIVATADSEWCIEYFEFFGVLVCAFAFSVAIIYKFCDLSKYQ